MNKTLRAGLKRIRAHARTHSLTRSLTHGHYTSHKSKSRGKNEQSLLGEKRTMIDERESVLLKHTDVVGADSAAKNGTDKRGGWTWHTPKTKKR